MAEQLNQHHDFLASGHASNERRAWLAISLSVIMMTVEIAGGTIFGSMAVVADGFHMATHAFALLIAALAYTLARQRIGDERFSFGTGKFGDLAGFTSAIVLGMIAMIVAYESCMRLLFPHPINFNEATLIAAFGFVVNVATAWLLSGDHDHGHDHAHGHDDHQHDHHDHGPGTKKATSDNNMRVAFVHIVADAAVSVLAIIGLLVGKWFGWIWMDAVMGLVGALVIGNWAIGLIGDTARVLLDVTPDRKLAAELRRIVEAEGDSLADLHVWRLGPGHLGAILSIVSAGDRTTAHYRRLLERFPLLSHVTIEMRGADRTA